MNIVVEHVAIDVPAGVVMESQSGLQNLRPRIYGVLKRPATPGKTAAIVMHPTSNYMGHYLCEPLAERGITCMALNSRYVGNDGLLQMERVIVDLGAGVKHLRGLGYKTIVLIGNSGGASLSSFYQSEAENLTALEFLEGGPTGLTKDQLPPADGVVLSAAHLGRSALFAEWLDPAVVDEHDQFATNLEMDLYDGPVKPPYTAEFVARFRQAQIARRDRLEAWVTHKLSEFRARKDGPADRFFLIHRTHADPRFLDLTLDANDRPWGSIWGDPRTVNYAANAFGRLTSLRAFMSQLSSKSRATGPDNLSRTKVAVLLMVHTSDGSTWPSTRDAWQAAVGSRMTTVDVKGGSHYLVGQSDLITFSTDTIAGWVERHVG